MAPSKHQKSIMSHSGDCKQRRVDRKINRLKAEMTEISKQQQRIRQGQKEIRERFEKIESECDQLKRETEIVSQTSDNIQLRLDIMLGILKARQENDFVKAADLTCSLRGVVGICLDISWLYTGKACIPEGENQRQVAVMVFEDCCIILLGRELFTVFMDV